MLPANDQIDFSAGPARPLRMKFARSSTPASTRTIPPARFLSSPPPLRKWGSLSVTHRWMRHRDRPWNTGSGRKPTPPLTRNGQGSSDRSSVKRKRSAGSDDSCVEGSTPPEANGPSSAPPATSTNSSPTPTSHPPPSSSTPSTSNLKIPSGNEIRARRPQAGQDEQRGHRSGTSRTGLYP